MLKKGGAYVDGKWVRQAELFFGSARKSALPEIAQGGSHEYGTRSRIRKAKYVPCFTLAADKSGNGALDFDSDGMPAGEPVGFVAADDVGDPLTFAVELADDSMEPAFGAKSTLIFAMRAGKETRSGQYALVRTPEAILFRQVWFEGDGIRLHPENPSYPEQRLRKDHIEGIIPLFARIERY